MRMRSVLFALTLTAAVIVTATAASAQSTSVGGTGSTGTTTGNMNNLPGMGSLPTRTNTAGSALSGATPNGSSRTAARPAARRSSGDPTRLPATGTPVAVFALLGVALVAVGRMLIEVAPAIRRQ